MSCKGAWSFARGEPQRKSTQKDGHSNYLNRMWLQIPLANKSNIWRYRIEERYPNKSAQSEANMRKHFTKITVSENNGVSLQTQHAILKMQKPEIIISRLQCAVRTVNCNGSVGLHDVIGILTKIAVRISNESDFNHREVDTARRFIEHIIWLRWPTIQSSDMITSKSRLTVWHTIANVCCLIQRWPNKPTIWQQANPVWLYVRVYKIKMWYLLLYVGGL